MCYVQLRVRLLVVAHYTLGMGMLWYVRVHSCRSYLYTWFGALPLQVSHTLLFLTWTFEIMVGPPPLLRAAISVSMVVDPPAGKSHMLYSRGQV